MESKLLNHVEQISTLESQAEALRVAETGLKASMSAMQDEISTLVAAIETAKHEAEQREADHRKELDAVSTAGALVSRLIFHLHGLALLQVQL